MGQSTLGKTFEDLNDHLDQRAVEARPEEKIVESDSESEPDLTWLHELRKGKPNQSSALPKQKDSSKELPSQSDNRKKLTVKTPRPGSVNGKDLHEIPVPPGSLSPVDKVLDEARPDLETSRTTSTKDVIMTDIPAGTVFSPARATSGEARPSIGIPMEYTVEPQSPAQPFAERASVGSPNQNLNPAPPAHSPEPYTPVQQEDAAIFEPKYFQLIIQRVEQDRERQRRKEDNAGFIAPAADPKSDNAKYAEMWDMVKSFDPGNTSEMEDRIAREHRELEEHAKYDADMQDRMKNEAQKDSALKAAIERASLEHSVPKHPKKFRPDEA
jgi:hypothetical protein